jgi:hypothetical protein
MPKGKGPITSEVVLQWSCDHLLDRDPTTFNRLRRAAARMKFLESEVNRLLSENGRLQLERSEPLVIAHRVRELSTAQ